jgi:hypothetical protein
MLQTETVKNRAIELRRWGYALWLALIAGFALLHAWHLRADFPNGSPWVFDWAKFTDEGWYGNAAIRAHLFGNWYVAGDFNPAVAVPVWPSLEGLLFFFTGVTVEAARGLAVACFFLSLVLSYLLLSNRRVGSRGPRWIALLGVTLVVTSPFLYCFSRLAILEPLQITLTLAALILAVRLPQGRQPMLGSICIGLLFALIVLTKTTGLFLLPALLWTIVAPLWEQRKLALRCALVMTGVALAAYGVWVALIASFGLLGDYKYYFFVNAYEKPKEFYWPLVSFWWSFHGLLWVDHSLILLAGAVVLAAAIAWRSPWGRKLWRDPLFGAALWAVAGYLLFMTLQNHPQPRYFAIPAFFCFFVVVLGAEALLDQAGQPSPPDQPDPPGKTNLTRGLGWAVAIVAAAVAAVHGAQTIRYATHPEYTWVQATAQLALYVDTHPNGKRLLDSISGDEITLLTHVPSLCDDFGTEDLAPKLAAYQPGWYASWNDLDPGTLEDLHTFYSLEQVVSFPAFDDPDRDLLVLFKLHPLPIGQVRDPSKQNLRIALPGDKIDVPIE